MHMRLTSATESCGNTGCTVIWMLSKLNPKTICCFVAPQILRSAEPSDLGGMGGRREVIWWVGGGDWN